MSEVVDSYWKGLVARVPCVICRHMGLGESPAVLHHMKLGRGASDRAPDSLVIALCPEHHVGPTGVHQLKEHGLYRVYKLSELDLLAMTIEAVAALMRRGA